MLNVNMDSIGEAAIVECEGTISGGDEALQLRDAVTGRAANRVIVIALSKVSVTVGKGLSMVLFLQRWARHRGIQLKIFNPCPSVRHDLDHAISPYELEFVSLDEVMGLLIDATKRQALAA
jgi:anti-anti-sigma regulatory factor